MLYYICVIKKKAGCDFSIVRCPMNTPEVLTLVLVIFAALSYIGNHNDKKK